LNLATLNSQNAVPAAIDSVFVLGWGDVAKEDEIQTTSDVLMGVEVKMITNEQCSSSQGSIWGYQGESILEVLIRSSVTFTRIIC
jgi:hypothetical protein